VPQYSLHRRDRLRRRLINPSQAHFFAPIQEEIGQITMDFCKMELKRESGLAGDLN
jgi:hypothetical protein